MTSSRDKLERAAFLAALIARHSALPAALIARHVTHLQRLARQAVNAETNLCDVPDYQDMRNAIMERLRKHADRIADELSPVSAEQLSNPTAKRPDLIRVELGGDPRGPCALLYIPGEPGDGYTPNAYAIY